MKTICFLDKVKATTVAACIVIHGGSGAGTTSASIGEELLLLMLRDAGKSFWKMWQLPSLIGATGMCLTILVYTDLKLSLFAAAATS